MMCSPRVQQRSYSTFISKGYRSLAVKLNVFLDPLKSQKNHRIRPDAPSATSKDIERLPRPTVRVSEDSDA